MMKFLILFISINKLLCVPIYQFQKSQLNHKMESYNYLEQYKMQQIYDALYQIFKNILKNPLTHIVVKENTPSTTEPYDAEADDEPYEDPVDMPQIIEEDSKDGILENNDDISEDNKDATDIPENIEEDSKDGIPENIEEESKNDTDDAVDIPE